MKNFTIDIFFAGVRKSNKTEIKRIFGKKNSLYINNIKKIPEEVRKITLNRL